MMGVLKYLVTLCHYIPQSGKPLRNRYYVEVLYCNVKTLRYYFHGLGGWVGAHLAQKFAPL